MIWYCQGGINYLCSLFRKMILHLSKKKKCSIGSISMITINIRMRRTWKHRYFDLPIWTQFMHNNYQYVNPKKRKIVQWTEWKTIINNVENHQLISSWNCSAVCNILSNSLMKIEIVYCRKMKLFVVYLYLCIHSISCNNNSSESSDLGVQHLRVNKNQKIETTD